MEQTAPKFSIGIDLGTTHCVLSYVDTQDENARVSVMSIPQLTAPGTVESRHQLGSFLYQPHEHDEPCRTRFALVGRAKSLSRSHCAQPWQ